MPSGRSKKAEGLEFNVTQQLLVYADYVNLWGKTKNIIKKNTEALLNDSEKTGLEVIQRKLCTYMFMSRHQTTGQIHYIAT
jgi:hypothetical protein